MSTFPDRLAAARRFAQLYAGGWGQAEAAKLAGAEATRARRAIKPPLVGTTGGTWAWARSRLYAQVTERRSDR